MFWARWYSDFIVYGGVNIIRNCYFSLDWLQYRVLVRALWRNFLFLLEKVSFYLCCIVLCQLFSTVFKAHIIELFYNAHNRAFISAICQQFLLPSVVVLRFFPFLKVDNNYKLRCLAIVIESWCIVVAHIVKRLKNRQIQWITTTSELCIRSEYKS